MLRQNRATMVYRVFKIILFAALLASVMQAIRLLLIEPDEMAQACVLNAQQWQCQLRNLVIQGFSRHLYGPVSLLAATLAWSCRSNLFAVVAMTAGMAGVVWYDFDLAAVGLILGALFWVRGGDVPVTKQQAQTE